MRRRSRLQLIPTFALGVAPESFRLPTRATDLEACRLRAGHPDLAWHLAESLILDEFDITIANEMPIDHGCTVPLSVAYGQPDAWPCRIIPLCVNVIQYPPPTGRRCYQLGKAIRRALDRWPGDERVALFGTGGMSHQLQGERAGLVNLPFDQAFMDRLLTGPRRSGRRTPYRLPPGSWLGRDRAGDVARDAGCPRRRGPGGVPHEPRPDVEHQQRPPDPRERLTSHYSRFRE